MRGKKIQYVASTPPPAACHCPRHRHRGAPALRHRAFGRENAAVRQDELVVHCVMRGKIWKQLGGMSLQGGMYVVTEAGVESVHEVKRQAGVFWEGIEVRSDPVGASFLASPKADAKI